VSRTAAASLRLAGCRYWTASLLPALVGTTLPFWLHPPGFSFRWLAAVEFLIATAAFHAGFSFLLAGVQQRPANGWPRSRLLGTGGACLAAGCLLGLHLNSGLTLHRGVPESIFVVYGACALFTGVLYVAPPLSFWRRAGGEVVLGEGLGLLPVLGAYLVQVGDITRKVYLASAPLVVATVLSIWIEELITRADDEKAGRQTMVVLFAARVSGRLVVPALAILLFATLGGAVATSSLPPAALVALLSLGLAWRIVAVSWYGYDGAPGLLEARRKAFALHLTTSIVLAASPLVGPGR
jgi:1,4-dihydroxy-2-naphthoate octaprenyltransferase